MFRLDGGNGVDKWAFSRAPYLLHLSLKKKKKRKIKAINILFLPTFKTLLIKLFSYGWT